MYLEHALLSIEDGYVPQSLLLGYDESGVRVCS